MKKTYLRSVIAAGSLFFSLGASSQDSLLMNAEPFLPQLFSEFPQVRDLAISSQENEIYFTIQSHLGEVSAIATAKLENGKWSAPAVVPFSGKYQDLEPFLTPDGLRLFFVSNRPMEGGAGASKDHDIWVVERKDLQSTWSAPKNIGAPVNTKEDEFYPTLSASNTLCFTRDGAGSKGKDDIFLSRWENNQYTAPVSMSDSVNTTGYEFNAFLAPDESFLLYTCYNRKGGSGSGDLYISFHKGNGIWTGAENLGDKINSPMMDYCPYADIRSGMLYFTSKRSTVKKQFDKNQNAAQLLEEMNKYENGQSRIYRVNIHSLLKKRK